MSFPRRIPDSIEEQLSIADQEDFIEAISPIGLVNAVKDFFLDNEDSTTLQDCIEYLHGFAPNVDHKMLDELGVTAHEYLKRLLSERLMTNDDDTGEYNVKYVGRTPPPSPPRRSKRLMLRKLHSHVDQK